MGEPQYADPVPAIALPAIEGNETTRTTASGSGYREQQAAQSPRGYEVTEDSFPDLQIGYSEDFNVLVTLDGQTYRLSPESYREWCGKVVASLQAPVLMANTHFASTQTRYLYYKDMWENGGLMQQATMRASELAAGHFLGLPEESLVTEAQERLQSLNDVAAGDSLLMFRVNLLGAESSINRLVGQVNDYSSALLGGSENAIGGLKLMRAAGAAAATWLTGGALMAYAGAGSTAAAVGSGAIVGGGMTLADNTGEYLAGQDTPLSEVVSELVEGAAVGAATSYIGDRILATWGADVANALAPRLTEKLGYHVYAHHVETTIRTIAMPTIKNALTQTYNVVEHDKDVSWGMFLGMVAAAAITGGIAADF